jgi:predicted heme/steroid binding protein
MSSQWPQGEHTPCQLDAMAGKDLSEVLEQAPARMRALIEAMPVVGSLEESTGTGEQTDTGMRVFTAAELAVYNGQKATRPTSAWTAWSTT